MEIIKSRGNKRISVPIHSDSRFSLTILEILIPLASFHSILFVIFSCCNISLLISPAKKIHDISREERMHFEELVKAFPFTINGMGEYKEAVITRGGVSVKDIQPGTMESRREIGRAHV